MTWDEEKMKFLERYPDCPTAEDIEVLDLVMCKKYALEILEGKKTVEFRMCAHQFSSRLYDKKVLDFLDKYEDIGCKSSSESYRKNTKTVPRKKEEVR